ncbi:MAG TPA: patatin-like phospholipase family protein [Thermoanaerobaculia bacterium]|nr:patatin-like phospholipase family protein [Thermoanaerobaculia bacterium]
MSGKGEPTHAVVISGGGANGAYAVGVLKALLNGKTPACGSAPAPKIYAGTSIGSFTASFLVSQWDTYGPAATGNLEQTWLERLASNPPRYGNGALRFRGDLLELLAPSSYLPNPLRPFLRLAGDTAYLAWDGLQRLVQALFSEGGDLRQRAADLLDLTAFVSTEPWHDSIRESIDFARIRSSTRQLRIAATNWTTGELRIFKNIEMTDQMGPLAIRASSAIPGIFPPAMVGAEPHVDGGVVMNTPLKPALEAGADFLSVIYFDPDIRAIPLNALHSAIGTNVREQQIAWAQKVNDDIEDARAINKGLAMLAHLERGEEVSDPQLAALAQVLSKIVDRLRSATKYKPLTIHRYHPHDDLAGGSLGLLNLDRKHIEELIARGFSDAVAHDCAASNCVLLTPEEREVAATRAAERSGGGNA